MFTPTILPEGTRVENYRIRQRLGRGGFGITYLASEYAPPPPGQIEQSVLRDVAMKEFFPQGIAQRDNGHTVSPARDVEGAAQAFQHALRAFLREALAIAKLDHTNLVQIHRVFESNGTAYFTMPYLRGESLRALLKREGTISEERARRLLLPVLDGLAYAHAKGVLHRDLKPDNLMIREDDGKPVLIDFGTARVEAVSDATQYTRLTDLVAYTPGYAALEQYARAASSNLHGPYTDLYAFAATLYEAMTGEAPLESARRNLERPDPLVPASARLIDTPGCSRAFLAAIDWGLELDRQDRPQTVAEFRDALNGKRALPQKTMNRLETHGVPTDPFTQPAISVTTETERQRLEAERRQLETDQRRLREERRVHEEAVRRQQDLSAARNVVRELPHQAEQVRVDLGIADAHQNPPGDFRASRRGTPRQRLPPWFKNSPTAAGLLTVLLLSTGLAVYTYVKTHRVNPPPAPTVEVVVDFPMVDTASAPGHTVAAAPYLHSVGISVVNLNPQGSEVVLVNNRSIYEGQAVHPTSSQNLLTQINTGNVPASFTLKFSKPFDSVSFARPALYPATNSGITHPAWSVHALDAEGRELSSQSEGLTRSFSDVPAQTYTLRAPGFDGIAAVRFDSDPRLNGVPFAAFSAILIERLTLTPATAAAPSPD